jgi:acyl-CoA synthetase (NDP forming)
MTIDKLFYPRGVAIVGSMGDGKLGNVLLKQVLDGGYKNIAAINPKSQGAYGIPGFRSLIPVFLSTLQLSFRRHSQ